MEDSEKRIDQIEIKLAYIEDFMTKIQSLSLEHADAIDRLKAENRALRAKLGELIDAVQDIPNNRPPHY